MGKSRTENLSEVLKNPLFQVKYAIILEEMQKIQKMRENATPVLFLIFLRAYSQMFPLLSLVYNNEPSCAPPRPTCGLLRRGRPPFAAGRPGRTGTASPTRRDRRPGRLGGASLSAPGRGCRTARPRAWGVGRRGGGGGGGRGHKPLEMLFRNRKSEIGVGEGARNGSSCRKIPVRCDFHGMMKIHHPKPL